MPTNWEKPNARKGIGRGGGISGKKDTMERSGNLRNDAEVPDRRYMIQVDGEKMDLYEGEGSDDDVEMKKTDGKDGENVGRKYAEMEEELEAELVEVGDMNDNNRRERILAFWEAKEVEISKQKDMEEDDEKRKQMGEMWDYVQKKIKETILCQNTSTGSSEGAMGSDEDEEMGQSSLRKRKSKDEGEIVVLGSDEEKDISDDETVKTSSSKKQHLGEEVTTDTWTTVRKKKGPERCQLQE